MQFHVTDFQQDLTYQLPGDASYHAEANLGSWSLKKNDIAHLRFPNQIEVLYRFNSAEMNAFAQDVLPALRLVLRALSQVEMVWVIQQDYLRLAAQATLVVRTLPADSNSIHARTSICFAVLAEPRSVQWKEVHLGAIYGLVDRPLAVQQGLRLLPLTPAPKDPRKSITMLVRDLLIAAGNIDDPKELDEHNIWLARQSEKSGPPTDPVAGPSRPKPPLIPTAKHALTPEAPSSPSDDIGDGKRRAF